MKNLILLYIVMTWFTVSATVTNVADLYSKIQDTNGKVGFLSQGNYETVHHILPDNIQVAIFDHTEDIIDCVLNQDCVAGLISGIPHNDNLNVFSSEQVSLRAMLTCPTQDCDDLMDALDA